MISHKHRCVFTHVPKTGGKAILSAFGLPLKGSSYAGDLPHIASPYGHEPLAEHRKTDHFRYFKFAFVRNPWDRLVSAFFYLDAGGCNEYDAAFRDSHLARYGGSFRAFVRDLPRHVEAAHFAPQMRWLTDGRGNLLTDFIGRFENIDRDFSDVAARLGLPPELPVLNRSNHRHYREYYDAATREIAAQFYRRDIEAFAYEF
jgi:hypothetical protein